MRIFKAHNTISKPIHLALVLTILLLPLTAFTQELGTPLTDNEILTDAVQIDHFGTAACALQDAGEVFCWEQVTPIITSYESFRSDTAGFSKLNKALNNDIARITMDGIHLCGIGKVSGVACVSYERPSVIAYAEVQRPPEPDASYLSISDLRDSSAVVCAIQTDNRVVCWGPRGSNSIPMLDVPPEAAYLKQLDTLTFRACGIDLNNAVVCWGKPSLLRNGEDSLFGDVDIAAIGPAKQIAMGGSGACIIGMDDKLECFRRLSSYTEKFSDKLFSSIELSGTVLCFETTIGEKECHSLTFKDEIASFESLLPPAVDMRLVSPDRIPCYTTKDDAMFCTEYGGRADRSLFPTAPQNLSVNFFSDTQGELTWDRASQDRFSSEFATGYEIFRDGVLIDRLPVVTSYYDSNTNRDAGYEVRATRALIAGYSSFVNVEKSPPFIEPTNPATPIEGSDEFALTGSVYSSSALELFYNKVEVEGRALTYNILRDGDIVRENSPASSLFQAALNANTTYQYEVQAVLDGNVIYSDSITLTTLDDGSGSASTPPENNPMPPNETESPTGVNVVLSGAVYSSTSLELFWNRAPISGVTYDVYRFGQLVRQSTPAISHFNGQLPPNNTFQYKVVAMRDGNEIASSTIEVNTKSGVVSEPVVSVSKPTTPEAPPSDVGPIALTGEVYSSTALELSWKRSDISGTTYNIFRDGELVRANSPAISQFQAGLLPNTRYVYTVIALLNGAEQVSETIELSTRAF